MRANYLFLSVLVMTGLTACQQESTPMTTVIQPETNSLSQPGTQPEQAGQVNAPAAESIPGVAKESNEEAAKEVAAIEKTNADKVVMEEKVKAVVTPASPVMPKPVVVSPPVVEKPVEVARVVEEVKPAAVIEQPSGDPVQGAKVARKCGACHTFDQGGKNKTGPNLFGVFGGVKGGVAGFGYGSYLDAQRAAGAVWDEGSLRSWLVDSKAVAKAGGGSSKMPAQKITGMKADDLIAYLRSLK